MDDPFKLHLDEITTLYAFIARDKDGNEGVAAFFPPGGDIAMPLVGADLARIELLMPIANLLATVSGQTLHLYHFTQRDLIASICPPTD